MKEWILTLLYLVPVVAFTSQDYVTISTPSGKVKGALSPRSNKIYRFMAIPFANPPARFEKAELMTPWSGIRDATKYGKSCMQQESALEPQQQMSEDCLTLDIYTPANVSKSEQSERKAVMVWIHGGGFILGNSRLYESSLLSDYGDVVIVAIQYRLGSFGFLYTQGQTTTNLGLWDQRLALQWVQNNIEAFGGNKDKVTVFGESAGAISISCHMISPMVDNSLFSRAILQSGTIMNGDKTIQTRNMTVDRIAKAGGCPVINSSADTSLECLRKMAAYSLVTSAMKSGVTFWPTTGDSYMPIDSLELLSKYHKTGPEGVRDLVGNLASYDMLIGHNGDEGIVMLPYIFLNQSLTNGVTVSQYHNAVQLHTVLPLVTDTTCIDMVTDILMSFYNLPFEGMNNKTEDERNLKHAAEFIGDFVLKVPPVLLSLFHSDLTESQLVRKQTYYYLFDHKPETSSPLDFGPGWLKTSANHADDMQFIFSRLPDFTGLAHFSKAELALSRNMMQYWTNFAKFGNPGSKFNAARGSSKWRRFTSAKRNYMRLTTDKDIAGTRPRNAMADIWLGILSDIQERRMTFT